MEEERFKLVMTMQGNKAGRGGGRSQGGDCHAFVLAATEQELTLEAGTTANHPLSYSVVAPL